MGSLLNIGKKAGEALSAGFFAAKGDLFAGSAANTAGVLSAPTNGKTLVADSGQTLGWNSGYPATTVAYGGQQTAWTPATSASTMLDSTLTVPARIAAGDQLLLEVIWTLTNSSGGNRTYTPTIKLGSTTIVNQATQAIASSASVRTCRSYVKILCTGTSAQRYYWDHNISGTTATVPGYAFGNTGISTASVDLTSASTIDFQMAADATTATQTLRVDSITLTHIPVTAV